MKAKKFGLLKKIWLGITVFAMISPQIASADFTCSGLNSAEGTKDFVIVVVEEAIGKPTSTGDAVQALQCFRKTTCTKKTDPASGEFKRECKSEYKESCTATYPKEGETEEKAIFCQRVQVFYGQSGIELLFSYIGVIYRWAAGIIGIVSVFYLVYGGIKISTAGDDASALEEAKTKIAQSIAGLVLLFLSAIILYTINPNFFTL